MIAMIVIIKQQLWKVLKDTSQHNMMESSMTAIIAITNLLVDVLRILLFVAL